MDIVVMIVFFAVWLISGILAGFMVYVTPNYTKGHIIAAVLVSWAFAMLVAWLVYMKRNPRKYDDEEKKETGEKTKAKSASGER